MKTLSDLKKRLGALPARRIGREHAARYAQFLAVASPAKDRLCFVATAVTIAAPVLPSPNYQVARNAISSAANIAKRLGDRLEADPAFVSERSAENSIVRLTENAVEAAKKSQEGWQTALQSQIEKWELIADVIARLESGSQSLKSQAARLKSAVDTLRAAKAALPHIQKAGASVKENLDQLSDSVAKLGLDTPFGRFLQAAASEEGAPLGDVQDKGVAQHIESHKLSGVFRVHLSF
jgi:hypothetical protein